ncbi:hypothetical protein AAC387_Pa09g2446 [Persea americana]|eukprot:TRINITY_DN3050_c3_g1_i1.p1 TRINITY_DN3050_c3_g1~~TRINITY_DN3050_c3_g1_i1.p1  ORF type:complete len:358 (-),score=60.52 TRINITY_DN3050_c3_g1_i1:459-1532(-)
MVSDREIANGVASILLHQSDRNAVTTVNDVVEQLEVKLGLDLSHKTAFIRDQIDLLLRHHIHTPPPPPKDHFALQFQNIHHPNHHHHPHFINPNTNTSTSTTATTTTANATSSTSSLRHRHHHLYEIDFQQPNVVVAAAAAPPPPPPPQQVPPPPKESAPTGGKRRGGAGGLNKLCGVSPALQAIVGEPAMTRTQIVKQLWAYIRKNNLQDPSNKRKIICNDELRLVFETDCTDMFKMNKLLAKHIITLEPKKDLGPGAKRLKVTSVESSAECTGPRSSPVIISSALANFLGTGEREMQQSEVMSRVWEYIRINRLEDPVNSMMILCDDKLQELFGCESFSALSISDMLMHHFFTES